MNRAPWIALLSAAACGTPVGTTTTPSSAPLPPIDQPPAAGVVLGTFAVYQPRSNVDPFPDAPDEAGWASAGEGAGITHMMIVHADPAEGSAAAVARRGGPAPKLPPETRMLYQSSFMNSSSARDWTLSSLVVASKPILDASDVATCEIVDRPDIVISNAKTESASWPWVHITWTPAAVAKLQAVVDIDHDAKLYLALGDDVVGDWPPAHVHDGIGVAEIKIPQPDARTAEVYAARNKEQLCPNGKP